MENKELDNLFDEAFENAYKIPKESVPQNVQLVLYGLYKHATSTRPTQQAFHEPQDLRNAFKMNAWLQIRHIPIDEAKQQYIDLINKLLKERNL